MHLAQLNVGRLVADTDDPKVAEFMAALDTVNGIGKRSKGFVWMMEGSGEPGTGNTEAKIGGDPRFVANLTVWEDAESLEAFVWTTLHRRFYERRAAWFEALGERHLVFWWIEEGHRPTLDEALERLEWLKAQGPSDRAFDWAWLKGARLWRERACGTVAAMVLALGLWAAPAGAETDTPVTLERAEGEAVVTEVRAYGADGTHLTGQEVRTPVQITARAVSGLALTNEERAEIRALPQLCPGGVMENLAGMDTDPEYVFSFDCVVLQGN